MEPRAHHIVIGLFTLVGVVAALVFALWLAQATTDRDYDYFEIGFERAVGGLSVGNPVLYSGIKVGDVLEMRLDRDDPRLVRVLVRVQSDIPIREDTQASLMLTNITGSMSVQFHGGSPEKPRLTGLREDPPLIKASPSPLGSLLADSENLLRELDSLLTNANRWLDEDNAHQFGRLLTHLEQISGAVAEQREDLGRAIQEIAGAAAEARKALASVSRLGSTAHELLDGDGRQILGSARGALEAVEQVAVRLDRLVEEHEGAVDESLRATADLQPALRELRSTLRSFGRVGQRLEEDPASFLFSRETIKEYQPR